MQAVSQIQQEIGEWGEYNFGPRDSNLSLMGIMEELGELAHAQLKGIQAIRHTPTEIREKKIDAVGDIFIFLCQYCTGEGIDLGRSIAEVWSEVSKRDFKLYPTNGKTS